MDTAWLAQFFQLTLGLDPETVAMSLKTGMEVGSCCGALWGMFAVGRGLWSTRLGWVPVAYVAVAVVGFLAAWRARRARRSLIRARVKQLMDAEDEARYA